MGYGSLPHKWINGIPYSGWVSSSPSVVPFNFETCIEKSASTIRINLLLSTAGLYGGNAIWKIPLLKNPSTEKPFRMNLTLWSYPAGTTQGHK